MCTYCGPRSLSQPRMSWYMDVGWTTSRRGVCVVHAMPVWWCGGVGRGREGEVGVPACVPPCVPPARASLRASLLRASLR